MRYKETGEVHLDFHGATNTTIKYIVDKFGVEAIQNIFFKVGSEVYKDIREHLEKGDPSELINFWNHFFSRENADFKVENENGDIVLTVKTCPAVRHVKKLGLPISEHFCEQTISTNKGLCHNTPYELTTEITGEGSCVQRLKRVCETVRR